MTPDTESLLREAERHLRLGDSARVERLGREVLAREEESAEAMNLLARAITSHDRLQEALGYARSAVAADDTNPRFLVTLGELLLRSGRHADAILTLQAAIDLAPNVAQAQLQLGHAYAVTHCPAAAEDAYRAAIRLWPDYPDAHRSLGRLLQREGRPQEAMPILERAIMLEPANAEAYAILAEIYASRGDGEGTLRTYERATAAHPNSVDAWHTLGKACLALGQHERAEAAWRRGLTLDPDHIDCLMGLAECLTQSLRPEAAIPVLRRVLTHQPDNLNAIQSLAQALFTVGNLAEAERLAQHACEIAPRDPNSHYLLGNVVLRRQQPADALACYRRARSLGVNNPKVRFAEASPLLMMGHFTEGWAAYEARLGIRGVPWKVMNPLDRLWDGRPIGKETLLVHTEQGLGDTLQFVRYLPLLREQVGLNARIKFLCEPELERLLTTVHGVDELLAPKTVSDIEYDVQVPLLSLPHLLRTTLETIPANVPYIQPPAGVSVPLPKYSEAKFRVAFAWAGRPSHSDDRMRSCSIDMFARLFDIPGVSFYSIQFGPRASDLKPYLDRPDVHAMHEQLTDLASTLSVIDQVDLVIAVDTSFAHLAGAYGKPIWTLLAHGAEWRWLMGREDSPWYPSMRLFRQRKAGDWETLFLQLRMELVARLAAMAG